MGDYDGIFETKNKRISLLKYNQLSLFSISIDTISPSSVSLKRHIFILQRQNIGKGNIPL